ncbi:MAG: hypothetical protein A2X86_08345 [Bdellovibrionales bacterium GWA2_49_15]|nr:MAG: hypothetical protein A2X86_08345 [Bdellovibrionales bacterium GWA2_49_15]HAZ11229.1 ABC transporter [Bdellovibrionales bacterium]
MDSHLALQLVAGSCVAGTSAYLGSLMMTKRMGLVGDALGHVALPGMGIALLLNLDTSLGALFFLGIGILLIWKLAHITSISLEALAGIIFVTSLSIGFLIIPKPELLESLIGDISRLSRFGVTFSVIISGLVFVAVKRIYAGMMLMNISEDLAFVEGITPKRYNLYYLICVAMLVSVGIKVTGSLLVGALVIVPSATARVLSSNLKHYVRISIGVGILSNVLGILTSNYLRCIPGPVIILFSALSFIVAVGYRQVFKVS